MTCSNAADETQQQQHRLLIDTTLMPGTLFRYRTLPDRMKSVRRIQEIHLHRCLQHGIGECLRAQYTDQPRGTPPARLLQLLKDLEASSEENSPSVNERQQ